MEEKEQKVVEKKNSLLAKNISVLSTLYIGFQGILENSPQSSHLKGAYLD